MRKTITKVSVNASLAIGCWVAFCLLIAVAVGLTQVKIEPGEAIKAPKEIKARAPISHDDVLSAADAREWRQEFLWHRNIKKFCTNTVMDDHLCTRVSRRL